ncbi:MULTISPECIES: CHAT domain-containing protein [Pseudanabaena]|uniref:CHAT domain-containing protein n=1 Tax=Pseudanabaena TaxID=1152 RepID=UPI00247AFA2D|nr:MULTISPECIES: CHAT domain-containing protein [Pseudanabaena]MEA5489404.1 CHAT domain-containing protein [Pseudanabaena sp. CCNP1317]WGS71882.1 tetratricopeptide repeat protein [Pseudanabaena galeata CCNP1313]
MIELNVRFTSSDRFVIKFDDRETDALEFVAPVNDSDRAEIRWYLESYAAHYMMDVDDRRAERIEAQLPEWGKALFEAIFGDRAAARIFNDFQDDQERGKILTIGASHPLILSLPWELLRDPTGTYLLHDNPRIAIRRKFAGVGGGRRAAQVKPKDQVRVLMVVSRPSDAGFLDPRAEGLALLEAIGDVREHSVALRERVAVEFLRPATLDKLIDRLEDDRLPAVDIVHFDGHGAFDPDGRLHERAKMSDPVAATKADATAAANTGYLLFEDGDGKSALITAETLGDMLNRQRVSAIILSACQSAAVGGDDALGSVAARLTQAGMPSVLAMQYSVLAVTARQLFGKFYGFLLRGQGVGEALENARRDLYLNKERGDRPRGKERVVLKVQDWFLPALYQVGNDGALFNPHPQPLSQGARGEISPHPQPLSQGARGERGERGDGEENPDLLSPSPRGRGARGEGNLRELQEAGFWGRSRELWAIERAFVRGTRRITISGFGGMGKTYLAEEAGRWLLRTGMFARVCFISFADFQGVDPVSYAVSVLATVLDTNLIDGAAATSALREQAVLVILDNLETLRSPLTPLVKGGKEEDSDQAPLSKGGRGDQSLQSLEGTQAPLSKGGRGDQALLDIAKEWSEAGNSRVLLTTRVADLQHPDYPNQGSLKHIPLPLRGLSEGDALDYFQSLIKLPPEPQFGLPPREGLLELFGLLDCHPLSLGLLAGQLKQRRALEVHRELAQLVADTPNNALLASLNLSVSRLDPQAQEWIKRLGVFQGGALEVNLLEITEIAETEWHELRTQLEATGLIQSESLSHLGVGMPFLKFHPTLAPAIWSRLTELEQQQLLIRHRQRYYQLSSYLYGEDSKNPFAVRAIAQRELPNLLYAVRGSIAAGEDFAVNFVDNVNRFLFVFGLNQDRENLTEMAQHIGGEVGSQTWFMTRSNTGEQLWNAGRYAEAKAVFQEILAGLGATPSFNKCTILVNLGRCYKAVGNLQFAKEAYLDGLTVAAKLEQSKGVQQKIGVLQADLADVLSDMGDYDRARESYEESLAIKKEIGGSFREEAVVQVQLGTLALLQNNLTEVAQRYQEALKIFQQLNEPASEATVWHQLGMTFEKSRQWEAAEQAYRQSAQISEAQGDLTRAVMTWNQLAIVSEGAGKLTEAEAWWQKVIAADRKQSDHTLLCGHLNNLANLLQQDYDRLNEAQQLAEESLAIKQTLDPAAANIWNTYGILAEISDKQGDPAKAKEYRRLSRTARANFAGTEYELRKHAQLIEGVVRAVDDAEVRQQLEPILENRISNGWQNLIAAIQQILNGERDEDILCERLDIRESQIVLAILGQVKR